MVNLEIMPKHLERVSFNLELAMGLMNQIHEVFDNWHVVSKEFDKYLVVGNQKIYWLIILEVGDFDFLGYFLSFVSR